MAEKRHISIGNGTHTISGIDAASCILTCEEGCSATIILTQPEEEKMDCAVTASAGSTVDVITVIAGSRAPQKIRQRGVVEESATIRWWNVMLPSSNCTWDLATDVTGTNGESTVRWIFHTKERERHHLTVRNNFLAKNGRGDILLHGVAEKDSFAAANGMIMIGPQGNGTDTYVTEKVLMLDASAKVDAVPALEIKTNDVKASHSATVSKLSEEDLFYMSSRGVDAKTARRMVIEGFLGSLLEGMEDAEQRERIREAIEIKIR